MTRKLENQGSDAVRRGDRPRRATLLLSLMGLGLGLAADDGSWGDSRGYTPRMGSLYSETGDPAIVLEKEYLELADYESGATAAIFQFRNSSKAPVVVECAFPVKLVWDAVPIMLDTAEDPVEHLDPAKNEGWDFGFQGKYPAQGKGPYKTTIEDWLDAIGIKHYAWRPDTPDEGGKFITKADYPTGRRDLPAEPLLGMVELRVRQDGKPVPIAACVADFGDAPGRITLHFRHRLSFAAGAVSRVEVAYALPGGAYATGDPSLHGQDDTYTWNYILETGASWKGPIGSLVLALPPDFSGELPSALKSLGAASGRLLYLAEAWEPKKGDDLDLSWTDRVRPLADLRHYWEAGIELDPGDLAAPAEGAKVLGASSSLAGGADAYVVGGILRKVDYGPKRLFDGMRETPWVEGKADDGIGEYVSFSIDRPMRMVAVQNGYLRSPADFPEKATWTFFDKNNRVKRLEIHREGGAEAAVLDLADTRDLQYFAVDLAPGAYRAVIASVYRGSAWRDTCLGELVFYPGSAAELPRVLADPFYAPLIGRK